jgi:hypothetical protein
MKKNIIITDTDNRVLRFLLGVVNPICSLFGLQFHEMIGKAAVGEWRQVKPSKDAVVIEDLQEAILNNLGK